MSLVRVHNFSISLDGFGTGEGQSHDAPFGHASERLHEWMFVTRWWGERAGRPGGSAGIDDAFVRMFTPGIGAEVMGAGKFGHPGWHENPEWKGWWSPNPPFHTPVFVFTHHVRPSIVMEGGTTFHFIDASPAEALEMAREAADGQDVRIGGGPTIFVISLLPGSSTTCTSWWSRSCSAEAYASGTGWRTWRRAMKSRLSPRPAELRM